MMEERYKKMFSRVKASPEKIQEVIAMTENKRPKRIVQRLLVTAAIMALAALTAMGANAASGGELFARIVSFVSYTDEDGTEVAGIQIELDDKLLDGEGSGTFEIIEGEDGKASIVFADKDGRKVTKEIDLEDEAGALEKYAERSAQLGPYGGNYWTKAE